MKSQFSKGIRTAVRQILFESFEPETFVIINNNPDISSVEIPKIYYNKSSGFVNDITYATTFSDSGLAARELDNLSAKFPGSDLGIFTTGLAAAYAAAFRRVYQIGR